MEFSVKQVADLINGEVEGDGEKKVKEPGKIEEGKPNTISFLANDKYEPYIYESDASAIIVAKTFKPKKNIKPALIKVEDPYSAFTSLLEEYDKIISFSKNGTEEPSYIGEHTKLGVDIYRGAFSYIGANCKIGDNVKIYPNAYIGNNAEIGDNTILFAGVKIYENCKIGKNCNIQAGAVIGSDGFGFAPQSDGSYKTIPQLGNVILEDNVSVGANTTIDCATLGATLIKSGVKIDNLVQIAHNVTIKEHTVIASQAGISGSTTVGQNCVIAGQAGLVGHINVANKTILTAKSGISKTIKEEGVTISGTHGIEHRRFLRVNSIFKNLPDLNNRIKTLEEKIINLSTDK